MKNTIKRTTALTAAIAAVATVGSKVNAEEVTTPVAPTTEPVAETTVATPTTTVSDEQVVTAKQTADNAQVAVETKQAELDNTQAERDAKAEELATAKEQEKALADKVEAAKDVTPEKVTELEQTATEKTAEKDAKAQAVDTAKADQTVKQADADKKASALEQAKAEQKDAENKVKEAEDAISGTAVKDAQDAKDAADQKVNDAIVTKNTAAKELEDSKKADAERDAKKTQITSEIPAKEATATTAGEAVKSAEKALNAIPSITNITINADWAKDAKAYLDALNEDWRTGLQRGTTEYDNARKLHNAKVNNLAKQLNSSAEKAIQVASGKLDDMLNAGYRQGKSELFDVNNLPQDVLNEANDQFITTLNEIRHALGLGDAKINTKNIDFAKEVAKRYVANNIKFINHSGKSIAEAAKALGYKYDANALTTETNGQPYENLATHWSSRYTTQNGKAQLARFEIMNLAAQSAISFMMEGAGGHFTSLASDDIQGVAYSTRLDERGNTIVQLHVLNANSFGQKQITDQTTTNRVLPETDRTTAQAKLDQAKAAKVAADKAVADAKAELARLNAEVSTTPAKQAEADKAAKALDNAKATQAAANKRLQDVSADNATKLAALNQARADKATADSNVTTKEQELSTATAALEAAKQTTATREKELENAVQAEKEAKKAVENAKELLANKTKLEADLAAKKAEVQKHCDDLKALENDVTAKAAAKTAAETALADAEKEYNRLLAIYTAERMVEPLIQDKLPEFVGGVNYGEDLVFELPELMIPEETPVVSNLAAAGNSNATLGQAVHNEGRGTVVNEEQLPNTGTGSEFAIFSTAALSILASLGLVATNRKKTQE